MSDLVQRLREGAKSPAKFDDTGWTAATCGLVLESADRIEHLERVLMQARLYIAGEALPTKQQALSAIDEALNTTARGRAAVPIERRVLP